VARLIVTAWWLLAGLWLGLEIASLTGYWGEIPYGALVALAVFIWATCRCPRCGLPVFFRPSGPPGRHRIRYFMTTPDRACPRCGLRFKRRKH